MNLDDLPQELPEISEAEFNKYRGDFFQFVAVNTSHLVELGEFKNLTADDALMTMIEKAIVMGLDMGVYSPGNHGQINIEGLSDEEAEQLRTIWEEGIPWPIARAIAESFGVDASAILQEHMKELHSRLIEAKYFENSNVHIGGVDIEEYVRSILAKMDDGLDREAKSSEDNFKEQADEPNRYLLHVVHDGHPCRHPFLGLESALAHAAEGTANGWLQSVSNITLNGVEVMSAAQVRDRVEQLLSIGNN